MFNSIDQVQEALEVVKYISDRSLAGSVYLSLKLGKPLLLEGEAGVGKTEVAKALALILDTRLIRLQCYEGLDVEHALYEWNYPKQILEIQLAQAQKSAGCDADVEKTIFSEEFLLRRPLLQAIDDHSNKPVVLLIDEIDRADEGFEAFLLEVLSDFQITIPEIGTITTRHRPYVIITSNDTRELHDALKRRCLYHWIDYPSYEKEFEIVRRKVPELRQDLARQVCRLMERFRGMDFLKKPGIAETLDWAAALVTLNKDLIDKTTFDETLGCVFKYREDLEKFRSEMKQEDLSILSPMC